MLPVTRLSLRLSTSSVSGSLLRPSFTSIRQISTVKATSNDEESILVAQRINRPCSPHLTIYQPQLTWYLSSVHRISGVGLAAGFYGLTVSYAFASLIGAPLDTATLVSLAASLPVALSITGKAIASFPFVFHVFNGFRHLAWDSGRELSLKGVYRTGYAVLAATALFGSYFAFFV